jgi:serine/threonine-protein kinase RsbW
MKTEMSVKIEVPADLVLLRPLDVFVRHLIQELPYGALSEGLAANLELVFNEAFMNIHDHAYRSRSMGPVLIEISVSSDRVEFCFQDEGEGFDPDKVPPPDPDDPSERGRGVWLMRHFMDEFVYLANQEGKNILRLIKRVPHIPTKSP